MRAAGLDLGSTTVKLVVVEAGAVVRAEVADATAEPRRAAEDLLRSLPPGCQVLATGYGRDLLEVAFGLPGVSEIKAHATGAGFLVPGCSAVIDVGGQDVKVIKLDGAGRVQKFEMNDRCAAGTGRFLEVMARRLGYRLEAFPEAAAAGTESVTIHSMCTVFAESEVVGLLNRGVAREDLGRALHLSVARRIASMFGRTGCDPEGLTLCTGGGGGNAFLVACLGDLIGGRVRTHPRAQVAGALGCALLAAQGQGALPV
ncbi:acyl-CoA dehydratase activase [Mesoterricola silvestris]|uniref:3-hydroxyacyl-ACP dehydratase n=1 Tax=Mesoterricola silvestris TaxID=2927979 RepID=A0AA48KAL1_9BACT|nr:acyl-CoA dehydratase activase [Mesoterricola silvestris]BDU71603.1 3-hydroxyacyl-ACP dehydratase [Mesoterricola silvestris]